MAHDTKHKLEETAKTLDEVAVFADYLGVLALGAGETEKVSRLGEQASDLRSWSAIYREAAASA